MLTFIENDYEIFSTLTFYFFLYFLYYFQVVQFTAQQINCVKDKKGIVVEGKEDAITNNFYVLAMQRDWDENENELKWKIVEFMILGSLPYQ